MNKYLTNIQISLRLMWRDRAALFFGYIFPLIFFFLFAQMYGAGQGGGVAKQVVTSVLIFGVLGNGFFGAGMRAVADREQNILRRFKVAPTNALPLLAGWLVTGWINYIPSALFLIFLGHFGYKMPWPEQPFTLFVFLSVAVLAFRAIGLIIASVVNSMQESQLLIQMVYLPMLFLSGATFPVNIMPEWLQTLAQFIPSAHLFTGLQSILLGNQGFDVLWKSLAALAVTLFIGLFLSVKLFRWEKEEKVKTSAKLWVLVVLVPFLLLGLYQMQTKESLTQSKIMQRHLRRSRTVLIRDARLFIGDGRVVERGGLLVKDGKIAQVFENDSPEAKTLDAESIDGNGKTLLPGLIDTRVMLSLPGGVPDAQEYASAPKNMESYLRAYLFSGVTAVRSMGDSASLIGELRNRIVGGEKLGAEPLYTGPMFTTRVAADESVLRHVPEAVRDRVAHELFRLPQTAVAAREQAEALKLAGVSALFADSNHLPAAVMSALGETQLPVLTTASIGSTTPPHEGFWIPSFAATEARMAPRLDLLDRSLVQQAASKGLIARTRPLLAKATGDETKFQIVIAQAAEAQGRLVTGTGSGNMFVVHGPAIHREMWLMVQGGASPTAALVAATGHAAAALGAESRMGLLRPGLEADLLLVDGNPIRDITVTERISMVMFRGERVSRSALLQSEDE